MAFTISARTLLELGKELISSDDVALYELIKNAVDAGSPKIEIKAQVILPYVAYKSALAAVEAGAETEQVFKALSSAILLDAPAASNRAFLDAIRPAIGDKAGFRIALK